MLSTIRTPVVAAVALLLGACAHVGQDEFEAQIASLRGDLENQIQEGDERTRGGLEHRMEGLEERMRALRADLMTLRDEFDVTIQELETALRFNVPVYFGFDDATIEHRGREVLDRFGDVVTDYYPDAQLTVEGFTDPSGSEEYNLKLGERRAEAVKEYLVRAGVSDDRIRTISYGEDTSRLIDPDGAGPGTEGWQNRRVAIVIDHDGAAPAVMADADATR